jgi:poly(3-hydroxybutyrate) depolymerase
VIEFHSVADATVPSVGGVNPDFARVLTNFVSTTDTFNAWASRDGCTGQRQVAAGPDEQLSLWYGCADGTLLEIWMRTAGGGHEWPTAPDAPVDASSTIAKVIAKGSLLRQVGRASTDPTSASVR